MVSREINFTISVLLNYFQFIRKPILLFVPISSSILHLLKIWCIKTDLNPLKQVYCLQLKGKCH